MGDMPRVTVPEAEVRAYHSVTQACNTGTGISPVLFDTELYDTDGIHPGANNGEFVIVTPGTYLVQLHLEMTTSPATAATLYANLLKNGTILADATFVGGIVALHETWRLLAGDIVKAAVVNSTGTNLTIGAGERSNHLTLTCLGAN